MKQLIVLNKLFSFFRNNYIKSMVHLGIMLRFRIKNPICACITCKHKACFGGNYGEILEINWKN